MNFFKINQITKVIIILISVWIGSAFIITLIEKQGALNNSIGDALWWTIVTMTTVGYGDITPESAWGRFFAIIIMLSGISLIAMITGTISSIFTSKRIMEGRGLEKITLTNHAILCGWNENAINIIDNLINNNNNLDIVLINEELENEINSVLSKYKKIKYVKGDYALDSILKNANIENAIHAIILTDGQKYTDDKTIIASLTMKNINSKIKIIADLLDKNKIPYLKRANADTIILKDNFESNMINSQLLNPGVPETIHNLMDLDKKNSLKSISIPNEFINKEFSELKDYLYKKNRSLCIAIYSENENLGFSDLLSSDESGLDAFIEKKLEKSGHALEKEINKHINLNPNDDYIIKKGQCAIIIS